MKRLLFMLLISLTAFFCFSTITLAYENEIKLMASAMAESITKAGKKSIAVLDITDLQGNVTELGRFFAEEFSVALTGKEFEVVDRIHLKTILKEHKLARTGIIDPTTAKKLGQIIGVDAVVIGTVTPFGDSVRLSIKVLDTATAKIIDATSRDIAKTKAIEELLEKGIESDISIESESTATTPQLQPKAISKVEVNEYSFEAKECKRSGQQVICCISVINNTQKAKSLTIYARSPGVSILVDDMGNSYNSDGVIFGGRGSLENSYSADQDVPPGLPMKVILGYRDVSLSAKYVNVIVDCWDYNKFKVVLRNIPLTK